MMLVMMEFAKELDALDTGMDSDLSGSQWNKSWLKGTSWGAQSTRDSLSRVNVYKVKPRLALAVFMQFFCVRLLTLGVMQMREICKGRGRSNKEQCGEHFLQMHVGCLSD